MKFVVFYRTKDMSVSLYANGGVEEDIKEFVEKVSCKIKNIWKSNSHSCSVSASKSNSLSISDSSSVAQIEYLPYESYMIFEKVVVCKIKTGIENMSDFKNLLECLGKFHYVYED